MTTIVRAASNDDNVFNVTADYVEIRGLTVEGAYDANAGMYLYSTDYCTIANNNCTNNRNGIWIKSSNSNLIYHNSFINNTYNAYSEKSANSWNSTEKITYTYNGSTYTNYLGNYWDNYTGNDTNNDGIGNTPYSINSDNDIYPLMKPFENYIYAPEEGSDKNKTEIQKGMSVNGTPLPRIADQVCQMLTSD